MRRAGCVGLQAGKANNGGLAKFPECLRMKPESNLCAGRHSVFEENAVLLDMATSD